MASVLVGEAEAQGHGHPGRYGSPAFARRTIAPVAKQVGSRSREKGGVGASDGIDRNHPPAIVDRKPEAKGCFLGETALGLGIERAQLIARGGQERGAGRFGLWFRKRLRERIRQGQQIGPG